MKFLLFLLALQGGCLCAKVESTLPLFDESIPMLWLSGLIYTFADLLEAGREKEIKFEYPPDFPVDKVNDILNQSIDFRGMFKTGTGLGGMPFSMIASVIEANYDKVNGVELGDEGSEHTTKMIKMIQAAEDEDLTSDAFTLETFRSLQQDIACVYGVVKDRKNKRVVVTFRGSVTLTDWKYNLNAKMTKMKTPKLIKNKVDKGLKDNVLVHEGFYEYLFDNSESHGKQRYDKILSDMQPLLEDGYKVYVTGHSLGAALSSLFSFKIAGSQKEWIPKPITCISYASPFNGGTGFRDAFHELEKNNLIRYLRITNAEDTVPTVPPFSIGIPFRFMKHVGIHLRLVDGAEATISHPKGRSAIWAAVQNSIFKPVWSLLTYHGLELHDKRMTANMKILRNTTIDDIYDDASIMGKSFVKDEL